MIRRLTLALLTLTVAAGPASQPATQPAHTPFVAVLLKDWPAWDRNHDGTLSTDEIDRAVRDPTVTGDDAAAAAALKLLSQNKKLAVPLPPLTAAYFADYDRRALALRRRGMPAATTNPAAAESATIDTIATPAAGATTRPAAARSARLPADFDLYFVASKLRIARGGPDRLPGRFVLDHTRQGPLGDCYFVAGVGALVARDPARLPSLLTLTPDHKYRVAFPGTRPVTIAPPTDAELAISSTTAGDGVWLAILEQGFGRGRAQAKLGTDDVEGTDQIRNGGTISATIPLLTGHRSRYIRFSRTVEGRKAFADRALPLLRTELKTAFADGRMVLASVTPPEVSTTQPTTGPAVAQAATRPSTRPSTRPAVAKGTLPSIPPNITTKHAYAVLAYDAQADAVTFWNPHGQQFHPKGPPGLTNGYPTDHGRFTVPLAEAYQFVTGFAVERATGSTTAPTTAPTTKP